MSFKSNKNKSNIQKIIAIVCIILVIVIWAVVFFATRDKKEPVQETTESTVVTTVPETTEVSTTTTYDYEMKIDMDKVKEAHEQNPDVVGWIYIDDTVIDYPIVKGEDNDEYLHADWTGEYSYSGCIFEDYRSDMLIDENTMIYGHNMAAGTMFHALKSYKDEEWGKDHLFVEIATLTDRHLLEVYSVDVLNGLAGADFEYWNDLVLDKTQYQDFLDNVKNNATVWYGGKGANNMPEYDDKLVTLQTCDTGDDDGIRCCVFAKDLGIFN